MSFTIEQAFNILELPPTATWEEVRQAYREMVKVWHPDRFHDDEKFKQRATRKVQDINEAYNLLEIYFQTPRQAPTPTPQPSSTPPPAQPSTSQHPSNFDDWTNGATILLVLGYFFFGTEILQTRLFLSIAIGWAVASLKPLLRLYGFSVFIVLLAMLDTKAEANCAIAVVAVLASIVMTAATVVMRIIRLAVRR